MFKKEIGRMRFKSVIHSDILAVAKNAYSNSEIKELCSNSERSLDEYIKILAECTPIGQMDNANIANFLKANKLLKEVIKQDATLIDLYKGSINEERALPVLAAEEIAMIVATAFLTGFFSEIAKKLVGKLFKKKGKSKKELRKALDILLSNPILPLLEKCKAGLTVAEIVATTNMELPDVSYFLGRYEAQGWLRKEVINQGEKWKIKKNRAKIIEGFLSK